MGHTRRSMGHEVPPTGQSHGFLFYINDTAKNSRLSSFFASEGNHSAPCGAITKPTVCDSFAAKRVTRTVPSPAHNEGGRLLTQTGQAGRRAVTGPSWLRHPGAVRTQRTRGARRASVARRFAHAKPHGRSELPAAVLFLAPLETPALAGRLPAGFENRPTGRA